MVDVSTDAFQDLTVAQIDATLHELRAERNRRNGDSPRRDEFHADLDDVDLGPWLRGVFKPIVPNLLCPDRGPALLYRGQLNGLHGESGSGKTWIALAAAAEEILHGRHVTWLHLEDPSPQTLIERLVILGVGVELIADRFHYKQISEALTQPRACLLAKELPEPGQLVVVDSLGEAFALAGLDENKDVDVGGWFRNFARTLVDAGATVLLIDHATKARDNSLYASGSKRKRAAITGASYLVEATVPLTKEHGGKVLLTVAKDRHGTRARGATAAAFELTSHADGAPSWHLSPPAAADVAERGGPTLSLLASKVVDVLKQQEQAVPFGTAKKLVGDSGANFRATTIAEAIELALARGCLAEAPGPRNARMLSYVCDWTDEART